MVIPLHCCLLAGLFEGLRCGQLCYQVTLGLTGGERGGIPPLCRSQVHLSCLWMVVALPANVLFRLYVRTTVRCQIMRSTYTVVALFMSILHCFAEVLMGGAPMAAPPSQPEDGSKGGRERGDTNASLAAAFSLRSRSHPLITFRALNLAAFSTACV